MVIQIKSHCSSGCGHNVFHSLRFFLNIVLFSIFLVWREPRIPPAQFTLAFTDEAAIHRYRFWAASSLILCWALFSLAEAGQPGVNTGLYYGQTSQPGFCQFIGPQCSLPEPVCVAWPGHKGATSPLVTSTVFHWPESPVSRRLRSQSQNLCSVKILAKNRNSSLHFHNHSPVSS